MIMRITNFISLQLSRTHMVCSVYHSFWFCTLRRKYASISVEPSKPVAACFDQSGFLDATLHLWECKNEGCEAAGLVQDVKSQHEMFLSWMESTSQSEAERRGMLLQIFTTQSWTNNETFIEKGFECCASCKRQYNNIKVRRGYLVLSVYLLTRVRLKETSLRCGTPTWFLSRLFWLAGYNVEEELEELQEGSPLCWKKSTQERNG